MIWKHGKRRTCQKKRNVMIYAKILFNQNEIDEQQKKRLVVWTLFVSKLFLSPIIYPHETKPRSMNTLSSVWRNWWRNRIAYTATRWKNCFRNKKQDKFYFAYIMGKDYFDILWQLAIALSILIAVLVSLYSQ